MATHSSILAWRIPMDRGDWHAIAQGVAKSRTRLSDFSTSTYVLTYILTHMYTDTHTQTHMHGHCTHQRWNPQLHTTHTPMHTSSHTFTHTCTYSQCHTHGVCPEPHSPCRLPISPEQEEILRPHPHLSRCLTQPDHLLVSLKPMPPAFLGVRLSLSLLPWNLHNFVLRAPEACSLSPALSPGPHVSAARGHIPHGITPPRLRVCVSASSLSTWQATSHSCTTGWRIVPSASHVPDAELGVGVRRGMRGELTHNYPCPETNISL